MINERLNRRNKRSNSVYRIVNDNDDDNDEEINEFRHKYINTHDVNTMQLSKS